MIFLFHNKCYELLWKEVNEVPNKGFPHPPRRIKKVVERLLEELFHSRS